MSQQLYDIGRFMYAKLVDHDTTLYDSKKMVQAFMVYANSVVADTLVSAAFCPRIILRSQPRVDIDTDFDADFDTEHRDPNLIELHHRMKWSSAIMKFWANDATDSHFGVGLNLYTHFTSPIRRYTDILIHRLLWNTIKREQIFKLTLLESDNCRDLQTLFVLNHNKRFYRRMINFERDWKIIDTIGRSEHFKGTDPIQLSGRIIAIGETYLKVIIDNEDEGADQPNLAYSPFHNMILRVEVMSKKMLESFENSNKTQTDTYHAIIEYERNKDTILSIKRYDMDQPYRLFDPIEVSIVFVSGIRRFRGYLD